jgi:cardiolipin synthase
MINQTPILVLILFSFILLIFFGRFRIMGCIKSIQRFMRGFPISSEIELPSFTTNDVRLLVFGNEILPAILNLVDTSKKSICIQVMLFHPDEAGKLIASHLESAARRGVSVRLSFDIRQSVKGPIYLPYQKQESKLRQAAMDTILNSLRHAGVLIQNNPPGVTSRSKELTPKTARIQQDLIKATCLNINHIDHRKIFIADDTSAMVGGTNIGNEYLYHIQPDINENMVVEAKRRDEISAEEAWQKWLDIAVMVKGPAAKLLSEQFSLRWEILGGDRYATASGSEDFGSTRVQVLSQRPGNEEIAAGYLDLIQNAAESIFISSPYVSYRPGLKALMAASNRGVAVDFVFPGDLNDVPVSARIFRSFTKELLDSGINVYESNQRMIHSKVMVVDHRWSTIGSFNFDYRSFCHDFEQNLVIDDRAFADQLINRVFKKYFEISTLLTDPYPETLPILDRIIFPFS